jgi:hypothetical protein
MKRQPQPFEIIVRFQDKTYSASDKRLVAL